MYKNVLYGIFSYYILSIFFTWWIGSLKKYDSKIPFLECIIGGWRYAPMLFLNELFIIILTFLLREK